MNSNFQSRGDTTIVSTMVSYCPCLISCNGKLGGNGGLIPAMTPGVFRGSGTNSSNPVPSANLTSLTVMLAAGQRRPETRCRMPSCSARFARERRSAENGRDAGFLSAKLATARFHAEHFLALAAGHLHVTLGGKTFLDFDPDQL